MQFGELEKLDNFVIGSYSACQASVGGTLGFTAKFWDNANKIVTTVLADEPNKIYYGGFSGNICSYKCPQTHYDGTSFG